MNDDGLAETDVVSVFLRNEAEILLFHRSEEVSSYSGRWGAVAGYVADNPAQTAAREIREETGLDPDEDVTLVRQGEGFEVDDPDIGKRWVVHPFLYDVTSRAVTTNEETTVHEWVAPPELLRRETVPDLWVSYDRVRPKVETVVDDTEHGSTYLSLRALEVLRDEAALASERGHGRWDDLVEMARILRSARRVMPVIENRVNRVMVDASEEGNTDAIERAAMAELDRALSVDERVGTQVVAALPERMATVSRSETVLWTLTRADPSYVLVAESRPGREGITLAERLAVETKASVVVTTDSAFGEVLAERRVEALLVGADAILPDGRIVNKVGTRGATALATALDVEAYVVTTTDKVHPARNRGGPGDERRESGNVRDFDPEEGEPTLVYTGAADIEVANPTFGQTPGEWFDAVYTEAGRLDLKDIEEIAEAHRQRRAWVES